MDRKGQMGIAPFILLFITVIVGIVLFQAMAPLVAITSTAVVNPNITYTMPVADGVIDLKGQDLLSTPIVTNATGGEAVPATNYTIDEGVSTTSGVQTIRLTTAAQSAYAGKSLNISYTYGDDGYIDSAGGRAIAGLIMIFAALSIAVVALVPTVRGKLAEFAGI